MHTARSRNDIDITQYRMRLRVEILELVRHRERRPAGAAGLAPQHMLTLMPAYTHTQPAQPITFAHYLLAVIELLGRDERASAGRVCHREPLPDGGLRHLDHRLSRSTAVTPRNCWASKGCN